MFWIHPVRFNGESFSGDCGIPTCLVLVPTLPRPFRACCKCRFASNPRGHLQIREDAQEDRWSAFPLPVSRASICLTRSPFPKPVTAALQRTVAVIQVATLPRILT